MIERKTWGAVTHAEPYAVDDALEGIVRACWEKMRSTSEGYVLGPVHQIVKQAPVLNIYVGRELIPIVCYAYAYPTIVGREDYLRDVLENDPPLLLDVNLH